MSPRLRPLLDILEAGLFGVALGATLSGLITFVDDGSPWYVPVLRASLLFGGVCAALAAMTHLLAWLLDLVAGVLLGFLHHRQVPEVKPREDAVVCPKDTSCPINGGGAAS
jgi:hypothetical protein